MAKAPPTETQLRTAKTDIRRLHLELARANQSAADYRARATKAEQEAAEWKARFDILLRRDGAAIALGTPLTYGTPAPKPLCTVCGKPYEQHGSYPTCATHPYTPDGTCRHVVGAACVGVECKGGCVRAPAHNGGKGVPHA